MKKKTLSEFDKLQVTWYAKLREAGFNDIEHYDGSLNSGIPRNLQGSDPELMQLAQEYYSMAYHFLHAHTFDSELQKVIWEYHTEGLSCRQIAKILKTLGHTIKSKSPISRHIARLTSIMKAKYLSV